MIIPADWTINVMIWAALAAAIAVWQVVTVRSRTLPSFGDTIRSARRYWILRWAVIVFWIWLGWHLFVRTTFNT